MILRKIMGLFVCVLVICSAAMATADVGEDFSNVIVTMDGAFGNTVTLFNLPNADGSAFNEAQIYMDGTVVDATITLVFIDIFGNPVAGYPSEDMWLESGDGGMVPCTNGSAADFATNTAGETSWQTPLNAAGCSEAATADRKFKHIVPHF